MLPDISLGAAKMLPHGGLNPFAEAILSFIDEVKENEDRKSLFYKEVVVAACQVYLSDEPVDQSLLSARQLSNCITDLESQHRKKSSTRRVFASAQPLVEGLLQYTNAIDTMIQADPTAGALIYGGAKLVLQLASGYTKYFEQIIQMMADVGLQLQYFHIYTREFASDKYMNNVLYNSYKDILWFWRDAAKVLNQRGKRFLAGGVLTPFNERYGKFKEKLDRNARNVRYMAQALHIKDQGSFSKSQTLQVNGLAKALERQEIGSLPGYGDPPLTTKHEEIRKWVSGGRASRIDPQADLDRHLSFMHRGTCQWIFDHPKFVEWTTQGEGASLWTHAAPGAGKSVMCASIIDKLKNAEQKKHRNVIYFFCRFDEPDKCRATSALKSIALQALKLIEHIPDELYQLYREEYSAAECFVANLAIAERVVEYLLKRIEYVYIIIDGLDECQESALLDSLVRLCEQKSYGIIKWFFSSRYEPHICKKFAGMKMETLMVEKAVVQSDIRKFLEDNADLLCGTCEQLDRITASSEGNFLSVRLTIDPFRNEELTCEEEFEKTLHDFQPELGRCWFRSLQKLTQRSDQIQDLARIIFTSVVLAAQPMTFNELLDLLAIQVRQEPSSRRQRTKSVVLSACSPFVEVDYESNFVNPTLRLVHKTIGDFLTQDPTALDFVTQNCYKFFVDQKAGNAELGKRCLTYLSYKRYADATSFDTSLDNEITLEHGFLKYAAVFWHRHLQHAGGSDELFEHVRDFLKSSNPWTSIRVQSRYAPHMFARLSYNSKSDVYRMHAPNKPYHGAASDEEYYAVALPSWIDEYGNQGDDLVWGYHMFVREWAEVLVGHPELIQEYFAQVLGNRGFWDTNNASKGGIKVSTLEGVENVQELLASHMIQEELRPTWQSGQMSGQGSAQEIAAPSTAKYVIAVLQSQAHRGEWVFHHETVVSQGGVTATVQRFKLRDSPESETEEDSDDERDEAGTSTAHEPAVWILSVLDGEGKCHWFHHVTRTGVLQKSPPLFILTKSLLLWPPDQSSILVLDLRTWTSSLAKLPKPIKTDLTLISQEYHFSPAYDLIHRAAIYGSSTNLLTITQSFFHFSSKFQSPNAAQILPAAFASKETTWRCASPTLNLPASFYWQEDILYAALGSSCVKIIHFPSPSPSSSSVTPSSPAATNPANPSINVLSKCLCIPSSSYTRNLHFLIRPDPTTRTLHAIFCLAGVPEVELPSVMLDFDMGGKESWEEYDASVDDGVDTVTCDFLKGEYATKEQAFSVPIRSGLDWRRSVYVTCW